jgi:hypothetical protein
MVSSSNPVVCKDRIVSGGMVLIPRHLHPPPNFGHPTLVPITHGLHVNGVCT